MFTGLWAYDRWGICWFLGCKWNGESDGADAHAVDALAAGFAETGDFRQAIVYGQMAIEMSEEAEREEFKQYLALYQVGKPRR